MSDTENQRTSSPMDEDKVPSSPAVDKEPSSPTPAQSFPPNGKDETSRDGSTVSRTEEDMDDTMSAITGNSSPVSHSATEPISENAPDEDFEIDTGDGAKSEADQAVVDSNVRRRPKGDGFYRQLDEGVLDAMRDERSRSPGAGSTSSTKKSRRPRSSLVNIVPLDKSEIDKSWLMPFEYGESVYFNNAV